MSILDVETLDSPRDPLPLDEGARVERRGRRAFGGSNLFLDQAIIRAALRWSKITGDARYENAARDYARSHPGHFVDSQTGLPTRRLNCSSPDASSAAIRRNRTTRPRTASVSFATACCTCTTRSARPSPIPATRFHSPYETSNPPRCRGSVRCASRSRGQQSGTLRTAARDLSPVRAFGIGSRGKFSLSVTTQAAAGSRRAAGFRCCGQWPRTRPPRCVRPECSGASARLYGRRRR